MSSRIEVPHGYQAQDAAGLAAYLGGIDEVAMRLGGRPSDWLVEEVGDGNLNLVFIVRGPAGGLAVKQALPYVRLVGESWPLPLSRAHYEHMALVEEARHAADLVPAVHHYDAKLALIVMELLSPHIIMRRGMIEAIVYPRAYADLASFAARTLFHTSDLALKADAKKALVGAFAGNTAMCKITEDLIFSEPYFEAELNRWTQPWLDGIAAGIRSDCDLKIAVSRLKLKFMGQAQALIHGDLHTGSVMVTPESTKVIDPEFAFVGPMGFDLGAVIANLLLNFLAQRGHEKEPGERTAYRDHVAQGLETFWNGFSSEFLQLWRVTCGGDAYPAALFESEEDRLMLESERQRYVAELFKDALGFAAAKMIRRILGLAHNIDLEWIEDSRVRARCEARALKLARDMMVNAENYPTIGHVIEAARRMDCWTPEL